MDGDILAQINAFAKTARERALTPEECAERDRLRGLFLAEFRANFTRDMDAVTVVNPDGSAVKLAEVRKKKQSI